MEGYRKAQEELKPEDNDLRILFQDRIDQSHMFHTELVGEVARLGEQISTYQSVGQDLSCVDGC